MTMRYRLTTNDDPTQIVLDCVDEHELPQAIKPGTQLHHQALEELRSTLDLLDPHPVAAQAAELARQRRQLLEVTRSLAHRHLKDASFLAGYVVTMLAVAYRISRAVPVA